MIRRSQWWSVRRPSGGEVEEFESLDDRVPYALVELGFSELRDAQRSGSGTCSHFGAFVEAAQDVGQQDHGLLHRGRSGPRGTRRGSKASRSAQVFADRCSVNERQDLFLERLDEDWLMGGNMVQRRS